MAWEYETFGPDGQCKLFGVNIFDYDWKTTGIQVKCPKCHGAGVVTADDGNAYFAWDAKSIFWGGYLLPKADLQSWRIVDARKGLSRDDKHFYILNKRVTEEEWNQKLL